jgi:hypothetical protein
MQRKVISSSAVRRFGFYFYYLLLALVFHVPNFDTNSSIQCTANTSSSFCVPRKEESVQFLYLPSHGIPTLSRSASEAPEIGWENAASIHAQEGVVDYS